MYFAFSDGINADSRVSVFMAFTVLTGIGVLTFAALKPVQEGEDSGDGEADNAEREELKAVDGNSDDKKKPGQCWR